MELKIRKDYIEAIKAKDETGKRTLSLLVNALDSEIKRLKRSLTGDEVLEVVIKECKKRHQSIEAYSQGQRLDLAEKEGRELVFLEKYLPKALAHVELVAVAKQIKLDNPSIHEGKLFGMMNKHSKGVNKPEDIKRAIAEA